MMERVRVARDYNSVDTAECHLCGARRIILIPVKFVNRQTEIETEYFCTCCAKAVKQAADAEGL
jgi:hypothetical protein